MLERYTAEQGLRSCHPEERGDEGSALNQTRCRSLASLGMTGLLPCYNSRHIQLAHHAIEGDDIVRLERAQRGDVPPHLGSDLPVDIAFLLRWRAFGALDHVGEREQHVVQANRIMQGDLVDVGVYLDERVAYRLELLPQRSRRGAEARGGG